MKHFINLEHATFYRMHEDYETALQKLYELQSRTTDKEDMQEIKQWICVVEMERDIKLGIIKPEDLDSYVNVCEGSMGNVRNQSTEIENEIQINSDISIQVVPNPVETESLIEVDIASEGKSQVAITDIYGKNVLVKDFETAQYQIRISTQTLPSGNYIIKVITHDGKTKVTKFVVK